MKEASGELSMTAITVVAIAAIGSVAMYLVYPTLKANVINQTKCANKFNCDCSVGNKTCSCSYYDENGDIQTGLICPNEQ